VFQSRLRDAAAHQGVRRIYFGQAAYLNPRENSLRQLRDIREEDLPGAVIYSYRVPNSGVVNRVGTFAFLRTHFQPTWADVPEIPWKTTPTLGLLRGTVVGANDGAPIYNAALEINTVPLRTQQTEPHGKFAFFETPPGDYSLAVSAPGLATVTTNVSIAAGQNFSITVVLPPQPVSDPGVTNDWETATFTNSVSSAMTATNGPLQTPSESAGLEFESQTNSLPPGNAP